MQLANTLLNLGGDVGNQVQKYRITPSEVHVLQLLHGNDAVTEIEIVDDVKRTSKFERERLLDIYASAQPDGSRRSPVIDSLFPGVAARLYETFDEMDLDESFFKAERAPVKKAAPQVAEKPAQALDDMNKAALVAYAKANDIEFDSADKKDELLAKIKAVEAERQTEAEVDDDGIEEMPDAGTNLFQ